MAQRATEAPENTEKANEDYDGQEEAGVSDDSAEYDEEQDKSEVVGMSMGM